MFIKNFLSPLSLSPVPEIGLPTIGTGPSSLEEWEAAMSQPQIGQTLIIRNYSLCEAKGDPDYAFLALPVTNTLLDSLAHHATATKELSQRNGTRPEGAYYLWALRGQGFYFNHYFAKEHGIDLQPLLRDRTLEDDQEHYRWIIHPQDLSDRCWDDNVQASNGISLFMDSTGGLRTHFRAMGTATAPHDSLISEIVYLTDLEEQLKLPEGRLNA